MSEEASLIAENIQAIREKIRAAEIKFNRSAHSVHLLAVSKSQGLEKIKAAAEAGQFRFGENYCQEAEFKIKHLKAQYSLEWHFIGSIQSNKTRTIAKYFDWVHSVGTIKIAKALHRYRSTEQKPLNICIPINVHQESTKSGIPPEKITELFALIDAIRELDHLHLRGLMAIPLPSPHFNLQKAAFDRVADLQQIVNERLGNAGTKDRLDTLSLGMSDDFIAAIAAGSTMVRIGTAIFGRR